MAVYEANLGKNIRTERRVGKITTQQDCDKARHSKN